MRQTIRGFITEYKWIYTILGIIGNVCFFVGSIFFLFETLQTAGTWLFIFGSLGMLIGSLGSAIVMAQRDSERSNPGRNQRRQDSRHTGSNSGKPDQTLTAPVMRGRATRRSDR
jgi:hypothetical protein